MKRTIIAAAVLALGAAGAGVSLADPKPNGHNNYGLCTAYFAHEEHNPNGQPGPFQRMQEAYDEEFGNGEFVKMCQTVVAGDGSPGNSDGKGGGKN